MMEVNKIICGDTKTELKKLPAGIADTIITSPPYWGLRDYGIEGQIGLEPTLKEYTDRLLAITQELKRVLKPTGVMFWNHGDCYQSTAPGTWNVEPTNTGNKAARGNYRAKTHLPAKCMVMQNYRLILRMIDDQGWILRNTIIWNKPNHMPSSVKDRFANSYEPVFMLVKNKKYWFDLDAVREPHKRNHQQEEWYKKQKQTKYEQSEKIPTWMRSRKFNYRVRDAEKKAKQCPQFKANKEEIEDYKKQTGQAMGKMQREKHSGYFTASGEPLCNPAGKNPGDLWTIPTQPFPEAHFATFPEKLVEPMILAGCPEWICKKCGKARERIVKFMGDKQDNEWHPEKYGNNDEKEKRLGRMQPKKSVYCQSQTIGWTDCGCKAGWRPGIVLDPFAGAATTCVVAKSHGRDWLGIELSPDYIKIAEKRLLNTMGRLL